MKKLILIGFLFAVLLVPIVSAEITYTSSTKTTDNSITYYSGIRYGTENNEWMKIEDMKSLKGTGIDCVVDYDGMHKAECLDWNYTSIRVKFYDDKITENKDKIQVKIYEPTTDGWSEKSAIAIDLSLQKDLTKWIDVNYGDKIHYGEKSTSITLKEANTSISEDAPINSADLADNNYGHGSEGNIGEDNSARQGSIYFKYNITGLPSGITITDAKAYYNIKSNTGLTAGETSVWIWGSLNQTWQEGDGSNTECSAPASCSKGITYNRRPNLDGGLIQALPNQITGWMIWDVDTFVKSEYSASRTNVTLYVNLSINPDSNHYFQYHTKESATVASRPYMVINFTEYTGYGINVSAFNEWSGAALSGWSVMFQNDTTYITVSNNNNPTVINSDAAATGASVNVTFIKAGYVNKTYTGISINYIHMENLTGYMYPIVNLTNCTQGNQSLTFQMRMAEKPSEQVISNLNIDFVAWLNKSIDTWYYNFSYSGDFAYHICIWPDEKLYVDAIMEYYDDGGINANYTRRQYFMVNATVSNATYNTIYLYLLNTSLSSSIKINVQTPEGLKQSDVIIKAQRLYIGESTYRTVAMGKTNFDGYDSMYLRANDVFYRFVIEKDNVVLRIFEPFKITDDEITLITSPEGLGDWFKYIGKFGWYCSFNDVTNITSCTYSDTSGLNRNICLDAWEKNLINNTKICNACDTSSSSTLICDFGAVEGRMFYYEFVGNFYTSRYIFESDWLDFSDPITWGTTGLLVAIILLIISALIGAYNPSIAIAISIIALIVSYAAGFVLMGWGAVIGIIIVGVIMLYKMRS